MDEKVAENLMQQYKFGKSLRSQVEEARKRMTDGIIFKCVQVVLDEKVLELVEEKEQKVVSERDTSKKKALI